MTFDVLIYLTLLHFLLHYSRVWNKCTPFNKHSSWKIWQKGISAAPSIPYNYTTVRPRSTLSLCPGKASLDWNSLDRGQYYLVECKMFPRFHVVLHKSMTPIYDFNYRTRAIITRGLYTFYPLFEVHLCILTLALCMVSIQERFLIKSGLLWRAYSNWNQIPRI